MDPTMQSPNRKGLPIPFSDGIEIPIPSGPHTYFNKTWVGRVTDGIGPRQAFASLSRHATPFQSATSVDGGTVDIPIVGKVRQIVDPDRLTIVNTTEPGHLLHPGNVHRSIVREGDDLYVVTHGYGTGILPSANQYTAPRLWESVDNEIRRELNPEIKSPSHAAEAVRDSAAHAGVPSRHNVFEFGFPAPDATSALASPRSDGDAVSATAGANSVGAGIPFVSVPAGSLVAPERLGLLDSAPMNSAAPGPFSTGGRFLPRPLPSRPLYPTGSLVPASNRDMQDRQGLLDDGSGSWSLLPAEDADRISSPVLRELQRYRRPPAAGVTTSAPMSSPRGPYILSSVGSEAGDVAGGVLKWIRRDLIPPAEASRSKSLPQGETVPDLLGDSDEAIPDAAEAAPLSGRDNRRYLSRRVVGQGSVFDTGAPAARFVASNAGLAPDSFEGRFGNWSATRPQQASASRDFFTGQLLPDPGVALPIFDLLDRSTGRKESNDEWEPQGTGIPMLDEYIRYLNREYRS